MTEEGLAAVILAELKRQAADPDRVAYVEKAIDLTVTMIDGDFDLVALARCILEALPSRGV